MAPELPVQGLGCYWQVASHPLVWPQGNHTEEEAALPPWTAARSPAGSWASGGNERKRELPDSFDSSPLFCPQLCPRAVESGCGVGPG